MGKVIMSGVSKGMTAPVDLLSRLSATLNDNSWELIRAASDAGVASSLWSVGDTKTISIDGTAGATTFSNLSVDVFILGFDHNAELEGSNRIHFQIGRDAFGVEIAFVDSGYVSMQTSGSWFNMNNSESSSGGWESSLMRTERCPEFKQTMPLDLQAALKTVTKYSDNTGGGSDVASYVTATVDEIFLLSEWEIHGKRTFANSTEQNYQAQYAWYVAGNPKLKYKHDATSTGVCWWLRSVYAKDDYRFGFVTASGTAGVSPATYSYGFAPAFCV